MKLKEAKKRMEEMCKAGERILEEKKFIELNDEGTRKMIEDNLLASKIGISCIDTLLDLKKTINAVCKDIEREEE